MIHFLISNLFLCGLIGLLFLFKCLLKGSLTSWMQYRLWYVIPMLLSVPFLPLPVSGLLQFFPWISDRFRRLKRSALPLQNQEIRNLYERCLDEMHITANKSRFLSRSRK